MDYAHYQERVERLIADRKRYHDLKQFVQVNHEEMAFARVQEICGESEIVLLRIYKDLGIALQEKEKEAIAKKIAVRKKSEKEAKEKFEKRHREPKRRKQSVIYKKDGILTEMSSVKKERPGRKPYPNKREFIKKIDEIDKPDEPPKKIVRPPAEYHNIAMKRTEEYLRALQD